MVAVLPPTPVFVLPCNYFVLVATRVCCILYPVAGTIRLSSVSGRSPRNRRQLGIADLRPLHILGIIGPEPLGFTTFFNSLISDCIGSKRVRDRDEKSAQFQVALGVGEGSAILKKTNLTYPASTSLAHLKLALLCCSRRLLTKPPQLASSILLDHLRRSQIRKMGEITHATIQGMFMLGFVSFSSARRPSESDDPSMIAGRSMINKKTTLGRPRHPRLAFLINGGPGVPSLRRPHRQHAEISWLPPLYAPQVGFRSRDSRRH